MDRVLAGSYTNITQVQANTATMHLVEGEQLETHGAIPTVTSKEESGYHQLLLQEGAIIVGSLQSTQNFSDLKSYVPITGTTVEKQNCPRACLPAYPFLKYSGINFIFNLLGFSQPLQSTGPQENDEVS